MEEDSIIAHKFAVMQQQLEQKDRRIQELEEENRQTNEKIDKLVVKMRKNGTNYWADEWEKVKEE